MALGTKPVAQDTVLFQKIEKHLAELVTLQTKQLKALRELSESGGRYGGRP